MGFENRSKNEYRKKYINAIRKIELESKDSNNNQDMMHEVALNKKISQYGIMGKNLKNLSLEEKIKFVNYIDEEIRLRMKISENYNTEYFVEQERMALQRKLKYDVLSEIEKLKKIANDDINLSHESQKEQKIISTFIFSKIKNLDNNFVMEKQQIDYINDDNSKNLFAAKREEIKKRIEEIKMRHDEK